MCVVLQSTLFKGAPEEFMRMLSLVVKHVLYLPQQVNTYMHVYMYLYHVIHTVTQLATEPF